MTIKCDICGQSFEKKKSFTNHRRWHSIPKYKEFQENHKKLMSKVHSGKILSRETRDKISKTKKSMNLINEKNHNWKGDNVGYKCLHDWVRKYRPKPDACQKCGKKQDYLEVANISGEYKRDIDDYIYLCVRCHKEMDGNLEPFIKGGEHTRFIKGHKNELRYNRGKTHNNPVENEIIKQEVHNY